MMPSPKCYEIIKEFEGCHKRLPNGNLIAYLCPAGVQTIGWGSIKNMDTGKPIKSGDIIDQVTAERWLKMEVDNIVIALRPILKESKVEVTQGMFDAIVSFAFNCGVGAFKGSSILRNLVDGSKERAADSLLLWDKATVDGVKVSLPGLVRRRKAERELFLSVPSKPAEKLPVPKHGLDATWFKAHILNIDTDQWELGLEAKLRSSDDTCATLRVPINMAPIKEFMKAFPDARNVRIAMEGTRWAGDLKETKVK